MLKKRNILIGICLLIIIILCFMLNLIKINKKNNNEEEINFFNTKIINGELINMLIQPNSDWSQLPLTKKFKHKFNSKFGVLGNIKADKIELDPYEQGTFSFDEYSYILVTKGLKQTAYIYHLEEKDAMWDDFWLTQTYEITDEYGNQLDMVSKIDKKTFGVSFRKLAWGYEDEKSVGVSENFKKKYSCFLDLFIHYSPIEFNQVKFYEEKSSWNKKEAYFEVNSILECKKRDYIVKFKLNKKGYLDDCEVELLNEIEYEGTSGNTENKLFYKNSNWDNIRVSENFKEKQKNKKSIFPDIDNIDSNFNWSNKYYCRASNSNPNFEIYGIKWKDGKFRYYLIEYEENNDRIINTYDYIKLPYENMTIEEVKEAYLNSIY